MAAAELDPVAAAHARCAEITRASQSNLWLVSRALPKEKHALFASSYASMRVIDDFVDDEFMGLPAVERAATRETAVAKIALWVEQASAAKKGVFSGGGGSYEPEVFVALQDTLSQSTLDVGPWSRLGAALTADIEEKPLPGWDAFYQYCVGATVAPAEIFLYVLACDVSDGSYSHDASLPLAEAGYEMGVFCYLTHIARDLKKDAMAGGDQLVTIPATLLDEFGATAEVLRNELSSGKTERAANVVEALVAKARPFRERSEEYFATILKNLEPREASVLKALLGVYFRIHDLIEADPEKPVKGKGKVLGTTEKLGILARAGLAESLLVR